MHALWSKWGKYRKQTVGYMDSGQYYIQGHNAGALHCVVIDPNELDDVIFQLQRMKRKAAKYERS